jgi:hypothetical protein
MDESAFRRARDAMTSQRCAFEKAILARFCACSLAERQNIAEREAVACGAPEARAQCAALRALLRQKSAFALKLTQVQGPLPHASEMKVECGGLQGMQQAAGPELAAPAAAGASATATQAFPLVADVHKLVQVCAGKFGGLANLPYSAIVQSVVAYRIRRRRPEQ